MMFSNWCGLITETVISLRGGFHSFQLHDNTGSEVE